LNDLVFIREQWETFIRDLTNDWGKFEQNTLKNHIRHAAEIVERMVEHKLLDIDLSNTSSFLYTEFNKIGLSVSARWIQESLPSNFKGKYSKSELASESTKPIWETVSTNKAVVEQDQFGHFKINGVLQQSKIEKPTTQLEEPPEIPKNKYTVLLKLIGETASRLGVSIDAIRQRYSEDSKLVEEFLEPIQEKQDLYAEYWSKISNTKNVLDDRNKWGDYEKIMAKFLMDSGETIAHIAKLMDYSSKFGSIGILNNPDLQKKVTQLGNCPKCEANIYFEINERLATVKANLQFEI